MRVLIFDGTPDEVHALVQRLVPAGASRTPPPRPSPPRESPLTPEHVRAAIRSDEHKAIYDAISAAPRRTLASYVADLGLPARASGGFVVAMQAAARKLGQPLERILGRTQDSDGRTVVWVPTFDTTTGATP